MGDKASGKSTVVTEGLHQTAVKGAGFLLWGWIVVTILNLAMIFVALALFAP